MYARGIRCVSASTIFRLDFGPALTYNVVHCCQFTVYF